MDLSESLINNYCVKNSELIEKEKFVQNQVNIYNKMFEFYQIMCKCKLQFVDTVIHVKSKRMYSNSSRCGFVLYLVGKIEYFRR